MLEEEVVVGGLTEAEVRLAEAHRGFVREMDASLGKAYGMGGGAVVAVVAMVVFVGWFFSLLTQLILWVPGLTAALASLFIVRRRIYRRRDRLRERVERYCEVNEMSVKILKNYYRAEDMYPFFAALFEETPRLVASERPAAEH